MHARRRVIAAATLAALTLSMAPSAHATTSPSSTAGQVVAASVDATTTSPHQVTAAQLAELKAMLAAAGYRIQPGDTLWRIAARYCRDGSRYRDLARGNGIANPDRIYAGRLLELTCAVAATRTAAERASRAATRTTPAAGKAAKVIAYARAQLGDAYVWGAAGPSRWDCSGLVMMAFRQVGISLPHQSGQMLRYGRAVARSQLRPGDLVWPHSGHVQIYVGNGRVIEAANPATDVVERNMYGFWTARRLL